MPLLPSHGFRKETIRCWLLRPTGTREINADVSSSQGFTTLALRSSKYVTLFGFDHRPKAPASLRVSSLNVKSSAPLKEAVKALPLTTSFSSCHVSTGIARFFPVKVVRFPSSTL